MSGGPDYPEAFGEFRLPVGVHAEEHAAVEQRLHAGVGEGNLLHPPATARNSGLLTREPLAAD